LIQKRNFEVDITRTMTAAELRERAQVFGVKVKSRRKADFVDAIIFQNCWGPSYFDVQLREI
jgi:hypothetical protein